THRVLTLDIDPIRSTRFLVSAKPDAASGTIYPRDPLPPELLASDLDEPTAALDAEAEELVALLGPIRNGSLTKLAMSVVMVSALPSLPNRAVRSRNRPAQAGW